METTLHISKIDESVMLSLRHRAQELHVSVEELVRGYLNDIGTRTARANNNGRQAEKFAVRFPEFGTWSEEDLEEFERNTAPFREIDPDLWK